MVVIPIEDVWREAEQRGSLKTLLSFRLREWSLRNERTEESPGQELFSEGILRYVLTPTSKVFRKEGQHGAQGFPPLQNYSLLIIFLIPL